MSVVSRPAELGMTAPDFGKAPPDPGPGYGWLGSEGWSHGSFNAGYGSGGSHLGGGPTGNVGQADQDPISGSYGPIMTAGDIADGPNGHVEVLVGHVAQEIDVVVQQMGTAPDGQYTPIISEVTFDASNFGENLRQELQVGNLDAVLASGLASSISSNVQLVSLQNHNETYSYSDSIAMTGYNENLLNSVAQSIQNDFLGGGDRGGSASPAGPVTSSAFKKDMNYNVSTGIAIDPQHAQLIHSMVPNIHHATY